MKEGCIPRNLQESTEKPKNYFKCLKMYIFANFSTVCRASFIGQSSGPITKGYGSGTSAQVPPR